MRPVERSDSRSYTGNSSSHMAKERVYFNKSKGSFSLTGKGNLANFERMVKTETKVEGCTMGKVRPDWTSPSFLKKAAIQPTRHKTTHIQRDTSGALNISNQQGRSSFLRSINR